MSSNRSPDLSPVAPLRPAAEQTRARIITMIERGTLNPGERLGSERDLAMQLNVSRSTLRVALGWLEEEGLIRRLPGRSGGTFIAPGKLERDVSRIVGIPEMLQQQGFTAGTRIVSLTLRVCTKDEATMFGIEELEHVVDLTRIRFADGSPLSLEHAVLRSDKFPGLPEKPLGSSLYDLVAREYGIRPSEASESIEVSFANRDVAAVLAVEEGDPLLSITRITQDQHGETFEFSHDLFRADRTKIVVRAGNTAVRSDGSRQGPLIEVELESRSRR